jgi:ATP-dependent RNA helicase DeaD
MDIAAALTYLAQRERPLQLESELEQAPKPKFKRREDRPERFERGEGAAERGGRSERAPRWEPAERPERTSSPPVRPERAERPDRPDRQVPPPSRDAGEHPRPLDRPERPARPERAERLEQGERPPRPDRPERPPRPEPHPERPAAGFGDRPEPRREFGFGEERGAGRRERDNAGLVSYRIEVGHRDGVAPREIVGAIANEAGLEGRFIGRIAIEEDHSLVDLPEGMPREIFQHLRGVFVRGKRLNISLAGTAREPDRGPGKRPFKPRELSPEGHDPGADRRPGPPKGFKPRRPPPTS